MKMIMTPQMVWKRRETTKKKDDDELGRGKEGEEWRMMRRRMMNGKRGRKRGKWGNKPTNNPQRVNRVDGPD